MPQTFSGLLRPNEIFESLKNMIISQHVFADNIKGTYGELASRFRVDGTLYGDTKLYYSTDILSSYPWVQDQTTEGRNTNMTNILELNRPADPEVQAITISNFRQIALTVDNYLSKRAWGTEGAFSAFNSVMLGWIRDTKKVYDSTMINSFVGTTETTIGEQQLPITPVAGQNDALTIAVALADLLVALKDVSRDYNDYGYMRSYDESDLLVVFNAKIWNQLRKADLPTVFHKEGLLDEFEKVILPARYFGNVIEEDNTVSYSSNTDPRIRTLVEGDFAGKHLFPGDIIPNGGEYKAFEAYTEDDTIAFKVMHKNSVPFMSAFETGTSFFNPRNLSENHYLTWGYSDLDYLANYPFITARFAEA